MTQHQSAMHELAEGLQDADATLTTSIADILAEEVATMAGEGSSRSRVGQRERWRSASRFSRASIIRRRRFDVRRRRAHRRVRDERRLWWRR